VQYLAVCNLVCLDWSSASYNIYY